MSLKKTLILALVLLGLGLYIYRIEIPAGEAKLKEKDLFHDLSKEQVESIEVINSTGSFTLQNTDPLKSAPDSDKPVSIDVNALKKWELADLKGSDLDRAQLNGLVTALLELKLDSAIPAAEVESDLGIYKLDKPELQLKLKTADKLTEITLCKKNDFVGTRYAKIAGQNDIYLVPDTLYLAANKSKSEFRNHNPLDFTDSELAAVLLKSKDSSIKLESLPDAKWQLVEPLKTRASDSEVSSLTMSIRNLKAEEFIDGASDRLAEYNLVNPELTVTLQFRESTKREPLEVRISGFAKKEQQNEVKGAYLFVQGKPTLYKLSTNPIESINKPVLTLRERKLFQFDTAAVQDATYDRGAQGNLVLSKDKASWNVNGKPADAPFVMNTLQALTDLQADSFPLEAKDYGFATPVLKVELKLSNPKDDKNPITRQLRIGALVDANAKSDRKYYAAVDDLVEPFIITESALNKISAHEEQLIKPAASPQPLFTPAVDSSSAAQSE